MSSESASLVILSMTQAVTSFTTFMPKISEVRKASATDPNIATDVRMGEVASITTTLAVATVVSNLGKTAAPMVIAIIMCVVMIALYEMALNSAPLYGNDVIRDA